MKNKSSRSKNKKNNSGENATKLSNKKHSNFYYMESSS